MTITKKTTRKERKKVLTKRLKEQEKNVKKIDRRIDRIEKSISKLEFDQFNEDGILAKLTWEYVTDFSNVNCSAIRSKEMDVNSKIMIKIQKWWEKTQINSYLGLGEIKEKHLMMMLKNGKNTKSCRVVVLAACFKLSGAEAQLKEKEMLHNFAKKWNITVNF